jgi:hypothetical protein
MTLVTEVSRFPPVELPPSGTQADYRVEWTIKERSAQPLFDASTLSYTPISELPTQGVNAPALTTTPTAISINRTRLSRAGLTADAYSRLFKIATRSEGWRGPGSRALHSASLVGFLNFWSLICGQAVEPEFTLLPNGHLGAEWYKNSHRHLDMEFADDQMVYFGLFSGATEIEGKENAGVIGQLLLAHPARPLRWKNRSS